MRPYGVEKVRADYSGYFRKNFRGNKGYASSFGINDKNAKKRARQHNKVVCQKHLEEHHAKSKSK